MKTRFIRKAMIFLLTFTIICGCSFTAFADNFDNITEQQIIDRISYNSDDFYIVENERIKILPSIITKSIYDYVPTCDSETVDNIINLYQDLEAVYNEMLDNNVIKVTDNGTFYFSTDNEASVQGGNVNKTVIKFGVIYQFIASYKCDERARKYDNAADIFDDLYYDFEEISDKTFIDAMGQFADDMYGGFGSALVSVLSQVNSKFSGELASRCSNVADYIYRYEDPYGVCIRTNAGLTMKVAQQSSGLTYDNVNSKAPNLTYHEA